MSFSKLMTLGQLKALGVRDDRWTVQDKLLMYKGVIRIHSREQKNQVKDTNVLKKKNYRKIAILQKEVRELHKRVALCMYGDKSLTRRLLQNHKELQLTYMNMTLDKVIEDLNHRLFSRKKILNLIRHKKSLRENQILQTELNLEELQFISSAPDFNRTDLQQQAISNAIQNYDVKFCAAKNIQGVYRRMLAVLRQDQRYYEAILVTLQSDSNIQHKCLIRATEMGQLAMEEMANMKSEYTRLEKEVRMNMLEREICLKEIRDRLVDLHDETQGLVRTESEFDIQMIQTGSAEEPKKKAKYLEQEIQELSEILVRLQEVTLVPNLKSILPSMLETLRQKKRLLEELKINAVASDDMLNKKNHADLMYYSLYHSGAEEALVYNAECSILEAQIEAQRNRLEKILSLQNEVSEQSVRLRGGLLRLSHILNEIKIPPEYVDEEVISWPVQNLAVSLRASDENEIRPKPPINEEVFTAAKLRSYSSPFEDLTKIHNFFMAISPEPRGLRIIRLIESKMKFIKMRLKEIGDPAEQERAFVAHFKHASEFMASNLYPPEDVVEAPALVVDVVLEDSQVPNRTEIKARSQQIYLEATRNPFEVLESKSKKFGVRKMK